MSRVLLFLEPRPAGAARPFPFRYELLDGFRGIAALAVVASHLGIVDVGREAVMMFFVISGYCIAASTESCRVRRLSFGGFMWRRLHRIYPPYFFAIVFYALTRAVKLAAGGVNDLQRPWIDWLLNLTLTQWLHLLGHPAAEAVQNPKLLVAAFWSLNYEDQFYLVMGACLVAALRWRIPVVLIVLALALAGLVWNGFWPDGWVTGFFVEYWLEFAFGVLLFQVLCLYPQPAARAAFAVALVSLTLWGATKSAPWHEGTVLSLRAWTEITTAGAFTIILYLLRPLNEFLSNARIWRPIGALGVISYSLYLIHQFNLYFVAVVVSHVAPAQMWQPLKWAMLLSLQITIAGVFWYLCERPFLNTPAGGQTGVAPSGIRALHALTGGTSD